MVVTTMLAALAAAPAGADPTTTVPGTTTLKAPGKATTTTAPARTTTTTVAPTTTTRSVPSTDTTFPPALLAIANSVRRSPPSSTAALLAALAPLKQLGYSPVQAAIVGMGQFPVAGPAFYTDDWLEPRPGPIPRLHMGDDIVAAQSTPIRAPIDGTLKYDTSDPAGYGLFADVTGADKTFYRMAHMSATVAGLATGAAVKQGQVVGFVGATGDATGPHVHFEVHPGGGAGVDPKPILDAWQAAAIAAVPALIRSFKVEPAATAATLPQVPAALPAAPVPFSRPLQLFAPIRKVPGGGEPTGLALIGLLALIATCGAALVRYPPAAIGPAGRGGRRAGRPRPTR
ncbi:MAG TPA: M23 family metallopeptidase [Acidimicrobiales bacterium]|nr:M23 family metallopeptidase [Acidimicrobiales bacterium]